MKTVLSLCILASLATVWACAGTTVCVTPTGGIRIIGPDDATITASGLEDALTQINKHISELEAQDPPNEDWIESWSDARDAVIKAKGGSQRVDGSHGAAGNNGSAP